MWRLEDVLKAVHGTPLRIERDEFTAISTDSRTIKEGDLFIPLVGPSFDGHTFVRNAYKKSRGGSLCQKNKKAGCQGVRGTIILVEDTTKALLDLARFKRKQLTATFIAITGSNGKTTTKELLVHMMSGLDIAYNEKNYNNQIGISQALLSIPGQPAYCILELGTNHHGEIAVLAELVEPDFSTITNINASHLEGLGDLDGVFREKLSLFEGTKKGGTILINIDDPMLKDVAANPMRRAYTCAMNRHAAFMLSIDKDNNLEGFDIALSLRSEVVRTTTRLLGTHNLYNILAAAAIASVVGVSKETIAEKVATLESYPGRFKALKAKKGYTVIDDSYNANPASMEWAITTLEKLPCKGRKIAVLGEMKELGFQKTYHHKELGRLLKKSGLSAVMFLGKEAKAAFTEMNDGRAKFFDDKSALIAHVAGMVKKQDIILVKGSRTMKMDEIVEALV
jgi:UDP-N-acetylmuramoyl-tripeptide--D-alanyl-D-alanine ligase